MQKWLRALLIPLLCFTFYNVLLFIEGLSSDILRGSPLQAYMIFVIVHQTTSHHHQNLLCISWVTAEITNFKNRHYRHESEEGSLQSHTGRQFFHLQAILSAKQPIFWAKQDKTGGESFCASIIEVRNTSKTSSELLYFQLESFCLVWAHHFHIYGDLSMKIRI